jgi:hypothetical protein
VSSKHHLNLSAFAEPLSKEAKYWIGFLLADGCITHSRNLFPVIELGLKIEDAAHVKNFATFVGVSEESVKEYRNKNSFGKGHYVLLAFAGKELIPQLAKYGIVPRKSFTATVHPDLEQDPDFWRGVVDGDGGMCLREYAPYPYINLCGSKAVVESFVRYLQSFSSRNFAPTIGTCRSIFRTSFGGKAARAAISSIYYDLCKPVLARKMATAEICKAWKSKTELKDARNE